MRRITVLFALPPMLAALALTPPPAHAQSCAVPPMSAFVTDTLIAPSTSNDISESGNYGPVGMSIAPDGRVFIVMMYGGQVQVWHPSNGSVQNAGTVSVYPNNEEGLLGIALSPDFATTGWLYVLHTDPATSGANRGQRVARYTYNGTLAAGSRLTNRKEILFFPRNSIYHAAGGLSFDGNGVLVIGTGDDSDPHNGTNAGYGPLLTTTLIADGQRSSANTNDLRGKVLRIKPVAFPDNQTPAPGEGTTYTIPAGNLWEKINNLSYNPGWNDSDDISKVRKEIYVMGGRNPFHPRVDTRSGWIFWGDVGPDAGSDSPYRGRTGHDHWSLATAAGNFGYPYCRGYNYPYAQRIGAGTGTSAFGKFYDCNATGDTSLTPLRNLSPNNTGIVHLPKSVPALAAYSSGTTSGNDPRFNASSTNLTTVQHGSETAIGGAMYRYDPNLNSPGKFPPYYEGKVFFFDWARRNFRVITLDSNGAIPAGAAGVTNFAPSGWSQGSYLDKQFGPDGMLYALRNSQNNYNHGSTGGALYRVRYTGTYDNACHQPFNVRNDLLGPGATQNGVSVRPALRRTVAAFMADGFVTLPSGFREVTLYSVTGRKVWTHRRADAAAAERVRLPEHLGRGAWQARLTE